MKDIKQVLILSVGLVLGLGLGGILLRDALLRYRSFERTVQVKGLSEREYPADTVIAPIPVTAAGNDAAALYAQLDRSAQRVRTFLIAEGLAESELSTSIPNVVDKAAREYGGADGGTRYTGRIIVTAYSTNVALVRAALNKIGALGKEGIVLQLGSYDYQTEFLFSKLNDIKPEMIQEASINARQAAQKFAQDSGSRLGKLKTASQGQFSISPRDQNNPHLKTIRVVVTMEYYLAD